MPAAFHPAVSRWLERAFDAPTPAQAQAWPAIQAGRHTLIAAPTGSGKTLAAFLAAIDLLVRESLERGGLQDETYVLYVSPLKALSNDIRRNLEAPLSGIRDELRAMDLPDVEIRTFVRTGDTPQHERQSMRRRPPHIVVTTPESLYILLGSESGRAMLASVRSVIVDEIHAMVGSKRGLHLALSLERLEALAGRRLTRIGLSATQRPIEEVARFLVGARQLRPDGEADCAIIDTGHVRRRDLQIEVPAAPLEAVMSGDVWTQVYDRLAQLAGEHRTTLIFVNTRRHAERVARHLSERLGETQVAAHHGSMAKELRFSAESRLKRGELKALVATASLELGIDIGDVDLVCQLGSPRAIAALLQRVGRSGHSLGGTPKGRLFPLSRDDLIECAALLDCVRRGELDRLRIPAKPLDVLAQQLVAEVAAREWHVDALFALFQRAYPYRDLQRAELDDVVRMLADGFTTRRGRRGALIHYDAVNRMVRGRRGARLTALTSGGTIPDTADYTVLLEPQSQPIGTINEDFAVESLQGDVFQLGNSSYRILRVEQGTMRVEDAHGQPPSIPFWLGEAPGRSDELSQGVSRLRHEIANRLGSLATALSWLQDEVGVAPPAAAQAVDYLASARAALGALPTRETVVLERFFDEAGGMQLVVHSPFGSRVNRAWGLALRKRFCRSFNFELQAAATEDAIVLSLTTAHSFELAEVARYLHSNTVRPLLVQALCAAPMFPARWRWSAAIALALPRFRGGRKVPAPLARMAAEDLLASVFPDQVACAENLSGELEIPDHPLVRQAIRDCLEEAMDIEGLEALLRSLESGAIRVVARDLTEASPLALEVLSARPYAFLDDAPLEERRTQAVLSRRWLDPEAAGDLGALDPAAIARVREEAWPDPTNADELHDALCGLTFMTATEVGGRAGWAGWAATLAATRRAGCIDSGAATLWVAAERLPLLQALLPDARPEPPIAAPPEYAAKSAGAEWTADEALVEIARCRLQGLGPVSAADLAAPLGISAARIAAALAALQAEGSAMHGRFTTEPPQDGEWCERGLLARIHRYTVKRLRAEIEPVEPRDLLRFLLEWQRALPRARMEGPDAVAAVLAQLEGFEAPAGAWETEILPARINEYDPAWLDEQCLAGRFVWTRLARRRAESGPATGPVRGTPIALLGRRHLRAWAALAGPVDAGAPSSKGSRVLDHLGAHGASFFDEIVEGTGLLPSQAEEGLAELVGLGLVNSDSFGGLRALLVPSERRRPSAGPRHRRRALFGMDSAGRWALVRREPTAASDRPDAETVELVARGLLRRWGVVFWRLIVREADWLPPWRELLFCYRRLEARGEIRGGRFVAGLSGEQFAAPEAVGLLREVRRRPREEEWVSLSAADPLNLLGILTPGPRLPALAGNRVLYRDGLPLATLAGGEVRFLDTLDAATQWQARNTLLRRHVPAALADIG
ncbi:MAG: DEAD/DEAH box helicase [Gammaproteobacteria bacterium]|nr:DEAD/DEAH box helicase [Gammaproteobacteria bacterium]